VQVTGLLAPFAVPGECTYWAKTSKSPRGSQEHLHLFIPLPLHAEQSQSSPPLQALHASDGPVGHPSAFSGDGRRDLLAETSKGPRGGEDHLHQRGGAAAAAAVHRQQNRAAHRPENQVSDVQKLNFISQFSLWEARSDWRKCTISDVLPPGRTMRTLLYSRGVLRIICWARGLSAISGRETEYSLIWYPFYGSVFDF
jgi:hypothetical protein